MSWIKKTKTKKTNFVLMYACLHEIPLIRLEISIYCRPASITMFLTSNVQRWITLLYMLTKAIKRNLRRQPLALDQHATCANPQFFSRSISTRPLLHRIFYYSTVSIYLPTLQHLPPLPLLPFQTSIPSLLGSGRESGLHNPITVKPDLVIAR